MITALKRQKEQLTRTIPALTPEAPAFFNPFFLTMKLAPMKKLEDKANTNLTASQPPSYQHQSLKSVKGKAQMHENPQNCRKGAQQRG